MRCDAIRCGAMRCSTMRGGAPSHTPSLLPSLSRRLTTWPSSFLSIASNSLFISVLFTSLSSKAPWRSRQTSANLRVGVNWDEGGTGKFTETKTYSSKLNSPSPFRSHLSNAFPRTLSWEDVSERPCARPVLSMCDLELLRMPFGKVLSSWASLLELWARSAACGQFIESLSHSRAERSGAELEKSTHSQ